MSVVVDHGDWLYVMAMTADECNSLEPYWPGPGKMRIGDSLRIDKPVIETIPETKYMETSEIIRKLELIVDHG